MCNLLRTNFYEKSVLLSTICSQITFVIILAFTLLGANATAQDLDQTFDIEAHKDKLSSFHRSPELLGEIDKIIEGLDVQAPLTFRIDLDLWKLKALSDISDTRITSDLALKIYKQYERKDYASDEQFGDTMQQLVQAFSKTKELSVALEIVQSLRESVYEDPNTYLDFIIDKCRMEIYIETFDYARALETELSILNNREYESLEVFINFKSSLYNEIAFLYNRLGNGEKALEYLEYAKIAFEKKDLHPADLTKARTLNNGNRGRAYLLMGNYSEAEKMGQEVLKAGQYLGENYVITLGYRLIGSAANNLGQYDKALEALHAGIELANTHNIATMQKYLYLDYALVYEKQGKFDKALFWHKKQFELEYAAQESVATARAALKGAEYRALENFEEIETLKLQNEIQREISVKDRRITQQLKMIIISLLSGVIVMFAAFHSLRKGQRKLVQSEKKAKESERKANIASQAKSEFLANMSHEIRTPMNGVLGMAQVLAQTPLNEKQKHYLDIIDKSGNNLVAIINDILEFSKIEADMLELNLEVCNLDDAIRDIVTLLSPNALEKNLDVVFEYDANLSKHFIVDIDRVKQVISNLIGNAIKFTPKGSVRILVSGVTLNGHADIKIDVKDTGIGISEDQRAMIFEKFTQAESSTTRRFGGTGLGLAISHRLAEAMKGTLKVTSNHGQGSTFTLRLPLEIAQPAVMAPEVVEETAHTPHPIPVAATKSLTSPKADKGAGRKIKILIAEDDAVNRLVVTKFLTHPRIDLTVCENGKKAVEAYQVAHFDMIFMDISMPVMDGVKATQAIRKLEANNERLSTPIICVSAHVMKGHREAFIQAGMDDYLSKPLNKQDVFKMLKKWLQINKTREALQDVHEPLHLPVSRIESPPVRKARV